MCFVIQHELVAVHVASTIDAGAMPDRISGPPIAYPFQDRLGAELARNRGDKRQGWLRFQEDARGMTARTRDG